MDKDFLIRLTNNLYRLTLLFPKKEPLRYKMRELADEILAEPDEKNFEILDSYFEVAKIQNWVSPSDILAIKKEYDTLRGELKKENLLTAGEKKKDGVVKNLPIFEIQPRVVLPQTVTVLERTDRQEKILEFLRESGRTQVWQIKQIFPEVTKRTLRRDFEYMLNQGIIERIGERNNTFYQIKTIQS